jgi:Lon protease-like protein
MPFELPLFPLNVVLFPGMPLPLHIFEPRYRLMIGRCLEGDRAFGVAQIVEGQEGMAGTTPTSIGTVAEIIEVSPFADGRMNLQTIGTRRFQILSTREQDEYLVASCEWFEEDPEEDGLWKIADRTRRTLSRYFESMSLNTQLSVEFAQLDVPHDPYSLSMFIAAIMALPSDQKQRLLEMSSTQNRLDLEEFLLERADIVQRAYAKHAAYGYIQPQKDSSTDQHSNFLSLN